MFPGLDQWFTERIAVYSLSYNHVTYPGLSLLFFILLSVVPPFFWGGGRGYFPLESRPDVGEFDDNDANDAAADDVDDDDDDDDDVDDDVDGGDDDVHCIFY